MMTEIIIITVAILWIGAGILQYWMQRRIYLAKYKNLGKDAWDSTDRMAYALAGMLLSPIFLMMVLPEYLENREIINERLGKKKKKKSKLSEELLEERLDHLLCDATLMRKKYETLENKLEKTELLLSNTQDRNIKLLCEMKDLTEENKKIKRLTGFNERFELMDFND